MNRLQVAARRELCLISALLLFMELAFIRWLPTQVLFLTFFTNTVLLASFLGMALGCLASNHRRDYLAWTPYLLAVSLSAAALMEALRTSLQDVVLVGDRTSPQMVFFGTEYQAGDVAKFALPIESIACVFFLLVVFTMVGPGQALGRRLSALGNPLEGYIINIGGSLAGIALFVACSSWLPPVWWFGLIGLGLAFLPPPSARRRWVHIAVLALSPFAVLIPEVFDVGVIRRQFPDTYWSPYYRINYAPPPSRSIVVNLLGHQDMNSRMNPSPAYALPHLINKDSGLPPFTEILIIGAGSGNDVSRAIGWGGDNLRIDAVEIDPVIYQLGRRDHPDRPYDDPRVRIHLDDGRNFLRATTRKYDLIIFALVDSLVLHSSFSNIRLESYLFTKEAMADVRRCLKPDGMFAMYNYFRRGWIVSRLAKTLDAAIGEPPLILTMPFRPEVRADELADGFTLFLAGPRSREIARSFAAHPEYRMPKDVQPGVQVPNGFTNDSNDDSTLRFGLTKVEIPPALKVADDDWPFLYLRSPGIPDLLLRGMLLLGGLSTVLIVVFARRSATSLMRQFDGRMFFLGAGFMLIETRAVVNMALLFGSTWLVNTVVFSGLLIMILAANLFVLKSIPKRIEMYYAALFALLALNVFVPLEWFLGLPGFIQAVASSALVFSPILFAGLVFALSFRNVANPGLALGYNIAGALVGGLAEYFSMLVGFRYLAVISAIFYLLSMFSRVPALAESNVAHGTEVPQQTSA